MSIVQRSLQLTFFAGILFVADLLYAQPPLPGPPRPNSTELEGLRAGFSGASTNNLRATTDEGIQTSSIHSMRQDVHFPEQLSPPKPVNQQASFMRQPIPQSVLPEDFSHEGLPKNDLNNGETDESDLFHPSLNRLVSAGKSAETGSKSEKSSPGGLRSKLSMPNITPLVSVGGTLLIVVASFLLLAALLRKVTPQSSRSLPKDAFECLGRYYLTQKHQLQVLRLGNRIVLVSVMSDGVSTLAEITDADEVVTFLGLCRRLDNNSATEMFRKTVASMSEEELSSPPSRSVVASRHKAQRAASFEAYSDPDESLATILARGRR